MRYRYAVVIEQSEENYGAYVPDLPGCVSVGDSVEETERNIAEAIAFHLEGLRLAGEPIPAPSARVTLADVVLEAARTH